MLTLPYFIFTQWIKRFLLKRVSLLGLRPTTAKKKVLEVLVRRHLERLRLYPL